MIHTHEDSEPIELVAFNIILDDLVMPDGAVYTGILGGGGAADGFRNAVVVRRVGIFASVGEDLPQSVWTWLRASQMDTRGLLFRGARSLRARQNVAPDGERTQTWLVPPETVKQHFNRTAGLLPPFYRTAQGFSPWHPSGRSGLGFHPQPAGFGGPVESGNLLPRRRASSRTGAYAAGAGRGYLFLQPA